VPLHDDRKKVSGVVIYADDVTEVMAQEAERRREKFRVLVENADQVALGLYDAGSTRLLYASPKYLELLQQIHGEPPERILNRPLCDFHFMGTADQANKLFKEVVSQRESQRLPQVRLQTSSGTESIWDCSLTPIPSHNDDAADEVGYLVVSAIEVTREVQLREELERVDRMKDLFLSAASHELRTPLVPLVGYSDLLERLVSQHEGEEGWDRRIGDYVHRFRGQIKLLRRLIDDLFDVARISNGKFSIETKKVDLRSVVDRAVEEAGMQGSGHKINVEASEAGIPKIKGDETRLVQVISNLLNNAIKYSSKDSDINVRLARESSEGGSGEEAVIEVQDFGKGIPPDDLPSIFTRFYQVAASAEVQNGGLGLGLFIAASIVKEHGGTISAISTPGRGSTFQVRLPLSD